MKNYIQIHDAAKDEWYKIDPRHQVIHLLPGNAKFTLCGISYTRGTYLPVGKTQKCKECERKKAAR